MKTPEHIKRIIERLEPVDREALERHLRDESIMGQLMCLQEIRAIIGDHHGSLMQDEVAARVRGLAAECEQHHVSIIDLNKKIHSVLAQRDELAAQNNLFRSLLAEHFEEWEKDSGSWDEFAWHDRSAIALNKEPSACLDEVKVHAIDEFKSELVKSVSAIYRPHIEGVSAVVAHRIRQEAK